MSVCSAHQEPVAGCVACEAEFDTYAEQQHAWEIESARLAARPWWKKASDAISDFASYHRWAIGIASAALAIVIVIVSLVALLSSCAMPPPAPALHPCNEVTCSTAETCWAEMRAACH